MKKKEDAKLAHKKKSLAGMRKNLQTFEELPKGFEGLKAKNPEGEDDDEDDDEEYYRQEVGQAPDKDLFDKSMKRKSSNKDVRFKKKRKMNNGPSVKSSKFKRDGGDNNRESFKKRNPKAKFKVTLNKKSPFSSRKKIHSKKKSK